MNLTQLAYRALRDLGCLRPGQSTSTDVLNDILTAAQEMIDSWQLDRFMIFTIAINAYTLTAGKQTYTIGPVGADIIAPRPTQIELANLIINTVTPSVHRPMEIINDAQMADIRVPQIPSAIPLRLYYDGGFDQAKGFGSLFFWPGPQSAYQAELFTWQQLQSFADLVTQYNFPPGYAKCIRKNLAVQIAPMMRLYAKVPGPGGIRSYDEAMLAMVQREAVQSKADLESYNAPSTIQTTDPAFSGGSGQRSAFNYAIGENSRGR